MLTIGFAALTTALPNRVVSAELKDNRSAGEPFAEGTDKRQQAAAEPVSELRARVTELCRLYRNAFGSKDTGLVYHHRLDSPRGVAALSTPEDIAAGIVNGKPMPFGYGSGIQDVALENGQLLFAMCEAHEATGDHFYAATARQLFHALRRLAEISPEPGFVPRGPHPDGRSYYRDSSRDQHAAYVEALWRFSRSPLAQDDDRKFAADTLQKIAARMERNGWRIFVEDNSHEAHVGWTWLQHTPIGAITLLSFLGAVADVTGDPHWRLVYDGFSAEKDGVRWTRHLHPDAVATGQPLTLYWNQFYQSLAALRRTESDPQRRDQIGEFLRRSALRGLDSNVFETTQWRRLDWAGDRDDAATRDLLKPLGFDPAQPAHVVELYQRFDRSLWKTKDQAIFGAVQKLCIGLPTVPLHAALLSEDPGLIHRVEPVVRQMVDEFLRCHRHYDSGENFNRIVILGILLDARLAQFSRKGP